MKSPDCIKDARERWAAESPLAKGLILATLLMVVIAYLPTLQFDYAIIDQWRAFKYPEQMSSYERGSTCASTIPAFYVRTGRPLVWLGECIENALVSRISDFVYLRPFSLAIVLATTLYLGTIIAPLLGGLTTGVAAAALFVFLPGYSFMYFMGMNSAPVLLCLIPAVASFSLLNRNLNKADKPGIGLINRSLFAPLLLFVSACMIYPAWAFVVIPVSWLYCGLDTSQTINKRAWRFGFTLVFYLFAAMAYFAIIKMMIAADFWGSGTVDLGRGNIGQSLSTYEFSPLLNSRELYERLVQAAKFITNEPPLNFTLGYGLLIAGLLAFSGCIGCEMGGRPKGTIASSMLWMVCTFFISIFVLIGTIAPWLFSSMPDLHPRYFLPVHLFAIAGIAAAISMASKALSVNKPVLASSIMMMILITSAAAQNKRSLLEVTVSGIEIDAMRSDIGKWLDNKGYIDSRYLLILPSPESRPAYIEKLLAGSNMGTAASWFGGQAYQLWMANAILRERDDHPVGRALGIAYCRFDQACAEENLAAGKVVIGLLNGRDSPVEPVKSSEQPFIINRSLLTARPIVPVIEIVKRSAIPGSSKNDAVPEIKSIAAGRTTAGEVRALHKQAGGGFWETRGPFPVSIVIELKQLATITAYQLRSDRMPESSDRMPAEWKVFLSGDGRNWREVDDRKDARPWTAEELREYKLKEPDKALFVKIVVMDTPAGDLLRVGRAALR